MRSKPAPATLFPGSRYLAPLMAVLLLAFLAACELKGPQPNGPEPTRPSLSTTMPDMTGVTQNSLYVRATGDWHLSVEAPFAGMKQAVSLNPSSGRGNTTVSLNVDPSSLTPDDYSFEVQLHVDDLEATQSFTFSFPSIEGVVIGPRSAAIDPNELLEPAHLNVAPSTEGVGSSSATLRPTGSTTLIVGLEAADAQLRAQGTAGSPSLRAQTALNNALSTLRAPAAVTDRFDAAGLVLVEVAAEDAEESAALLRATPGVRYVELPQPLYSLSNDQYFDQQWNLQQLGVESLWPKTEGSGVTIAIIDNGFYPAHPDLRGNIVGTYDAGEDKTDVTVTNPDCVPNGAHGTHVAGIAAAVTNNNIGVAGVAPRAKLLLVDIDDSRTADCEMTHDALIRALKYVVNDGSSPRADVINMSIGTKADLGQGVFDALKAADDAGISLVAAAGNTADNCPYGGKTSIPVYYPAKYPMVMAVGATGRTQERACYSHIGPELFIVAPGGDTFDWGRQNGAVLSTDYDIATDRAGYAYQEGTSMAAPAVAGVIALLRQADPTATSSEIANVLADTAIDLGPPGRDNETGHGFLNPLAAYAALTGREPEPPTGSETLILRIVPGGYPDAELDPDGIFTALNATPGRVLIKAGTYNDAGQLGGSGELYGEEEIIVAFDQRNTVQVVVERVP